MSKRQIIATALLVGGVAGIVVANSDLGKDKQGQKTPVFVFGNALGIFSVLISLGAFTQTDAEFKGGNK